MRHESIDVERSVLGCLILFPELFSKISLLEAEDFSGEVRKSIFKKLRTLHESGASPDSVSVLSMTDRPAQREEIILCCETTVAKHCFDEHLRILKEISSENRLIETVSGLMFSGGCTLENLKRVIEGESKRKLFNDFAEKNRKNIDRFSESLGRPSPAIETGFLTLDSVLGGIRRGCVFILGARPSAGKTAFAVNVAVNQLRHGRRVLIFSLEMSAGMIFERVMASELHIAYEKFSQNTLSTREIDLVKRALERIKQSESLLVADDIYSVELICSRISQTAPDLAVVDFMQIVTSTQRFESVRVRTDYISGELKRVAKKTGCTILLLSQLARGGREAPTMSDLKESGGLEQDGDYIALLHRPYVLKKDDCSVLPETTHLLLDKNKFGRTGKVELYFDLKHQKFYETDSRHKEQRDGRLSEKP